MKTVKVKCEWLLMHTTVAQEFFIVVMQSVFDRETFTVYNWFLSQTVLLVLTMKKKIWVRRNYFVLTLGARPVPDKIYPEKEQF